MSDLQVYKGKPSNGLVFSGGLGDKTSRYVAIIWVRIDWNFFFILVNGF